MQFISTFLKQVQRVLNTTQSTTPRQAASGSWRFSLSQGWLVMLLPVVLVLTSCGGGGGGGGGGGSTPATAPNLTISTPSANPSSPVVSTPITLSVTITNEGTAEAASGGSITYYRSDDATITSTDTSVGFGSLPAIAQGSSLSQSAEITVPAATGTYYYGACVSHDDNSSGTIICSSAASVKVVTVPTPDLSLRSASAVPDAVPPGAAFTFSITVYNSGTANAASSSTITYYRSNDAAITSADDFESLRILAAISSSGSSPQSITITAPDTEGTYYYGACISHADDANPSNDCSTGIEVEVARPDLQVRDPAVSTNVILSGRELTVSVEVRNTGDLTAASGGTLVYYRSTDDTISNSDTRLGSETLPTISSGDSTDQSFSTTSPSTAGVYYYGACVSHDDDSNSANDCSVAVQVAVGESASAISAGGLHTCAILSSTGAAKCWGWNGDGRLGDGSNTQRNTPVQVSGLTSGVSAISAGDHTCAILSSTGAAKCWGQNGDGRLGDGSNTQRNTPVQVSGLTSDVTVISAGDEHTCAIHNGAAKCWGENEDGRLGDGTRTITEDDPDTPEDDRVDNNRRTPVQVTGLTSDVTAISAGSRYTCAIHNGAAKCWGYNNQGQLGDGSTTTSNTPVQVSGLTSGVTAISAGASHSCALHNGAAKCWGWNHKGQLGDSSNTNSFTPTQVTGLTSDVTAISAGVFHTCALHNGAAKCWGSNSSGSLGDGSTTRRLVPVQVRGLTSDVTAISVGSFHTCALHLGIAKCWGYNINRQLGDGSTTNSNAPVSVSFE